MRKIILSEEQIKEITDLYNSGLSYDKIAKQTGIDANKVKRSLIEFGVKLRPHKSGDEIRRSFTEEEQRLILELYNNMVGITYMNKNFGFAPSQVRAFLRSKGVKIRNPEEAHAVQKMGIDECYFDNVDNQDKAYILGFLYADGSNYIGNEKHRAYQIKLTLKADDIDILERMRAKMGIERKITIFTRKTDGRQYASLTVKNKHMSLRLNELGVVPAKTFVTRFPEFLSDELVPHFIRGLLDGDGCIAKSLKTVQFAGSHGLMCALVDKFEKYLGFTAHIVKIKHSPGISSITVAKKEYKIALLNWLYNDADLKLERKYRLYLQILDKYSDELVG